MREAVGRTSMPKKALRPPARGKPIQRVKVYPTWKDEKGVINTNIMAQPKQVKLESLGYKKLHVYKGIYDQMLVLDREPTKAGKPPHNEIEFEQGEHDKLNELIGQLEPMAETVLCYESEAKTAQPWQNLDFGPVSTCVTITCILSDGTRIGAHEGWQLRVGGGAMATLKRVIGGRKLTQVIVNGVLNEWFWKKGATELACQMSPEYEQASWKPIMTTGEQGARQWEDFRKWLSGQFGQVEVKRDGEIDGERRVLRPAHCPICRSEAEHGRFHGRV